MNGPAYWAPDVQPIHAKAHPLFVSIAHAGPWMYRNHPNGGTIATWEDVSHNLDGFQEPRQVVDGLFYLAPKEIPHIHDLIRSGGKGGVDVKLACGVTITVPMALSQHRQLRLGRGVERYSDPVTEYGRLASDILARVKEANGLPEDDPDMLRLIELAINQRYRCPAELFDDMRLFAPEDMDPLLGAIWCGDPKAPALASAGETNVSPTSASASA